MTDKEKKIEEELNCSKFNNTKFASTSFATYNYKSNNYKYKEINKGIKHKK